MHRSRTIDEAHDRGNPEVPGVACLATYIANLHCGFAVMTEGDFEVDLMAAVARVSVLQIIATRRCLRRGYT